MKGRDALREMLSGQPAEAAAPAPKRSSGAVRAMSLELQQLSEDAAAARALRETLAAGESVLELAPADIDASPVSDRIPVEHDPAFEELKAAIADKGQQVPILVRPHPEKAGRYQVAYGRRRLRAALELGKVVKAIVRELSDRDLVIAQAQENGPRVDLSFIERALFAANLKAHRYDRDTIVTALGVDKPEVSRLLSVAETVTPELIFAIGPAPKIGRPRWLVLASSLGEPDARERVERAISTEEFKRLDSNARFNRVLSALTDTAASVDRKDFLSTSQGLRVASWERIRKGIRVASEVPAFGIFLEQRLQMLVAEFETTQGNATNDEKGGSERS
jgi:ParB family transcriptional regulator, chromosome partitioning protein